MPPQELPHTPSQEERPASASFEQRTAAWTGIVYMLCLMFVTCYSIYTGGKTLPGTFPLLLIPVAAASVVIAVYRRCKGAASSPCWWRRWAWPPWRWVWLRGYLL